MDYGEGKAHAQTSAQLCVWKAKSKFDIGQNYWRVHQGWIQGGGGGGGGGGGRALTQKINLKRELNSCVFLHQKCFNINSNGHKEPQNCHLMLVNANCDDSVTIPTWLWT